MAFMRRESERLNQIWHDLTHFETVLFPLCFVKSVCLFVNCSNFRGWTAFHWTHEMGHALGRLGESNELRWITTSKARHGTPCRIHMDPNAFAALWKKSFSRFRSGGYAVANYSRVAGVAICSSEIWGTYRIPALFCVHPYFLFRRVPDVIRMSIWKLTKVVEKLEEQEWKANPVAFGSQQTMTTGCSLWVDAHGPCSHHRVRTCGNPPEYYLNTKSHWVTLSSWVAQNPGCPRAKDLVAGKYVYIAGDNSASEESITSLAGFVGVFEILESHQLTTAQP